MKHLVLSFLGISLFFSLVAHSKSANSSDHSNSVSSTVLMQTSTSWDGEQIIYPKGNALVTALQIEIEPGGETGWHFHPVPSFAYVLQGSLELTLGDGRVHQINAGEAAAEVTNTAHIGKNKGDETVKLIVFYTGTEKESITMPVGK